MTAPAKGHRAHTSRPSDRSDHSAAHRSHLLAELDRLGGEITTDLRCMDERNLSVALKLAEIEDSGMRAVAGWSSLTAYAREVHALAASTTSEWLSVGRACRRWPEVLEPVRSGRVCWSSARDLAKVATDEDRGEWLEKALRLKWPDFHREVQRVRPSYNRPLSDLSGEEVALLDAIVQEERERAGKPISYQKALVSWCLRKVEGDGEETAARRSRPLVVIDSCPDCKKATLRSAEGSVPIGRHALESAMRDAQVIDVLAGTGEIERTIKPKGVKRAIPAKVQRHVDARDKGRCVVPGCRNRLTQTHHMDGWRSPVVSRLPRGGAPGRASGSTVRLRECA